MSLAPSSRAAGAAHEPSAPAASRGSGVMARLDFLFTPVSPASLGVFRICFGLLMIWHLSSFMPYITETLVNSKFFLTYDGFHWIRILPKPWMVTLFWVMFAAAALVTAGLFYRVAAVILWAGWTYTFLLCQGHYNNHSYLFALTAFLMIFLGANRWLSAGRALGVGSARRDSIPFWQIFILRAQIVLVYFYAGIAKLGGDWLRGYPMKIWLANKADFPVIGSLLASDWAAYLFSYGALLFDLSIGFLLLWPRTRRWALIPLVFFHVVNQVLWNIGIFPWFMLAATSLFFAPDWPERLLGRASRGRVFGSGHGTAAAALGGAPRGSRAVIAFVAVYLLWQALLPLRHFTYAGSSDWTGQGSHFSWRMLTVDRADAVRVRVALPGQGTVGYVELGKYINDVQFGKMTMTPKQYLRFAHFIRDEMQRNAGIPDPEVYVDLKRRLNERPFQQVIDPELNLAAVEYQDFADAGYILPLDPALRPGTAPEWRERLAQRVEGATE